MQSVSTAPGPVFQITTGAVWTVQLLFGSTTVAVHSTRGWHRTVQDALMRLGSSTRIPSSSGGNGTPSVPGTRYPHQTLGRHSTVQAFGSSAEGSRTTSRVSWVTRARRSDGSSTVSRVSWLTRAFAALGVTADAVPDCDAEATVPPLATETVMATAVPDCEAEAAVSPTVPESRTTSRTSWVALTFGDGCNTVSRTSCVMREATYFTTPASFRIPLNRSARQS